MIAPTRQARLALTMTASIGLLLVDALALSPDSKKGDGKSRVEQGGRGPGGSGMKGGGRLRTPKGFSDLDESTRQRIREALQEVMSNPEVVAAREELNRCSEGYRATLRKAISDQDPEIGLLLTQVMEAKGMGGGGPGSRGSWMTSVPPEEFASQGVDLLHADLLRRLDSDRRQAFVDGHPAAKEAPKVQAVMRKILAIEDPNKRLPLGRELRTAYLNAIEITAPESVKEIRRLELGPGPGMRKGGNGGAPQGRVPTPSPQAID